jgi:hypothetical protein
MAQPRRMSLSPTLFLEVVGDQWSSQDPPPLHWVSVNPKFKLPTSIASLLARSVTCRREDRRWVTDVKHYQDSMGRIVLTGKPVTAYDDSCPSYSKLFDLINNVKEVQEVTAAYSVEGR